MSIAAATGPRKGAAPIQLISAAQILAAYQVTELHDGDALGFDASIYHLAKAFGIHCVMHPPINEKWRAFCGDSTDEIRPQKGYIARDKDMVNESDFLIAAPDTYQYKTHSGTWTTIEYARSVGSLWQSSGLMDWSVMNDGRIRAS